MAHAEQLSPKSIYRKFNVTASSTAPVHAPSSTPSNIVLTKTQQSAVDMVVEMLGHENKSFPVIAILSGYAGTGKTTTIRQIAKTVRDLGSKVIVLAPTGKASLRVQEATGLEASTIHRWCYKPVENPKTGETTFVLRTPELFSSSEHPPLVIIDEVSMVGRELMRDVYKVCKNLKCHLLCVGDRFQLPPVEKLNEVPFSVFTDKNFPVYKQVHLTEVMRQALDNPIIRASMLIRDGDVSGAFAMLPAVAPEKAVGHMNDVLSHGGVAICYTNRLRHVLNGEMRMIRGYREEIQPKEPLMVIRNCYDIERFNGEVLTFGGFKETSKRIRVADFYKKTEADVYFGVGMLEDDMVGICSEVVHGKMDGFHYGGLQTGWRIAASGMQWAKSNKSPPRIRPKKWNPYVPYVSANFGYALTCHKSQGSQFPDVLVFIENALRTNTEEGRRWAYTAVTRSTDKIAITRE